MSRDKIWKSVKQADGNGLSREIKFKWDPEGDCESHKWKAKEQSFQK